VSLQEEQQRKEKEEDAREQARLQAEQQKLKQQFAEEKEAEKAKRALESGVRDTIALHQCICHCFIAYHACTQMLLALLPQTLSK